MSFFVYDITFLAVFCIFLAIFLYIRRKKLKREGVMFLYRTKVGLEVINYIGKKWEKPLRIAKYFVIILGFISMILMIILLIKTVQIFLNPAFVQAIKIPPLAPLIPYLPELFNVTFLPPFYFTYWIIAIAIVAVFHEFAHGIFARLNNIKIKSTGFAFLGPFFGAFVEPDENKMKKIKKSDQIAILGAGTFANWLMVILFLLLLWLFFSLSFAQSGVIFNTYAFSVINSSSIDSIGKNLSINFDGGLNLTEITSGNNTYYLETSNLNNTGELIAFDNSPALKAGLAGAITKINNKTIRNDAELGNMLLGYLPGDNVSITTTFNGEEKNYNITFAKNPENKSKAYLGIATLNIQSPSVFGRLRGDLSFFKNPNVYYAPKYSPDLATFIYNLLWWIILINFSVALVNMLPVGIFDGGRFFYLTMLSIFKKEKIAKILFKISTYLILGIFALLMVLWAAAYF